MRKWRCCCSEVRGKKECNDPFVAPFPLYSRFYPNLEGLHVWTQLISIISLRGYPHGDPRGCHYSHNSQTESYTVLPKSRRFNLGVLLSNAGHLLCRFLNTHKLSRNINAEFCHCSTQFVSSAADSFLGTRLSLTLTRQRSRCQWKDTQNSSRKCNVVKPQQNLFVCGPNALWCQQPQRSPTSGHCGVVDVLVTFTLCDRNRILSPASLFYTLVIIYC